MSGYEAIFKIRAAEYARACEKYPLAREEERKPLVHRLKLQPGLTVLDFPAGNGYLADGLKKDRPDLEIICAEPVKAFYDLIPPVYEKHQFDFETIHFPDGTFDRIGSLAGLHHLKEKNIFFDFAYQTLKPEGIVAAADVKSNTPVSQFLNGFVDRYSSTGHEGIFFKEGEFSSLMKQSGFSEIEEEYIEFYWAFRNWNEIVDFAKNLFGLSKADDQTIRSGIKSHFQMQALNNQIQWPWALVYAKGLK